MATQLKQNLFNVFKRVVVINLPQRVDRLANFQRQLNSVEWPFREVEVVRAIHGDTVGVRDGWQSGGGAYGCMRSHTRVLEDALMDGIDSILVFEDDAFFLQPETWRQRVEHFFGNVPADWECAMLGGQHIGRDDAGPPVDVADGVQRCTGCERTHCYGLRGRDAIRDLYRLWCKVDVHIDWKMGPFFGARGRTYAPAPFLVGQEQGKSDISGRNNGRMLWSNGAGNYKAPVYLVKASRERFEEMKAQGYHGGYTKNKQGFDVGLERLFASDSSSTEKVRKMREWIKMIDDEAFAIIEGKTAIWMPEYTDEQMLVIEKAAGERLKVITGSGNE